MAASPLQTSPSFTPGERSPAGRTPPTRGNVFMESSEDVQSAQQLQKSRRIADRDRKRAVRACDGCRRQKEKCDGGVPCRRCARLRRKCEFLGLGVARPGGPATEIASARGSQAHSLGPGSDELAARVKDLERLLQHYAGDINLDPDNLRSLAMAVDRSSPPPAVGGTSVSQASDYLGAEEENFTVKPLENNITHYSGEFSHWNFSMRIKQWIEQCVPEQQPNNDPDTPTYREYYRPEELQTASDTFTSLTALPPRHVADFLVQAFFKHAQTNYFYVERGWLLDKLDIVYGNAAILTRRDVGTVCMIFIILAIGTQYAYLDSPTSSGGDNHTGPFTEDAIGVMFYQQACKLVPDVITVSSLESVQACLLIGIYTLPLDPSGLSYIYLNMAVKLAIQNGMHRRYLGEGLDPMLKETRCRVWWTAYTTERRVGIFHGRPISIASSDVDADMPVERLDLWPSSTPSQIPALLATLQLHSLLSRISQEISGLKPQSRHSTFDTLARLADLKNDVHKWWDALPEALCRKDITSSPQPYPVTRSEIHLRLEYCLVRMFTGRPFVFLRVPTRSNPSASSSPATQIQPQSRQTQTPGQPQQQQQEAATPQRRADSRSALVADCVEAALEVIDTCKVLRAGVRAARASYTEFSSCRVALLVIITQCLRSRTDRLRQSLRDGVAVIKIMSAGGESAHSEVSLIEVFERAIARLDAAEEGGAGGGAGPGAESDYARFKKWEMLWQNDSSSGSAVVGESVFSGTRRPGGGGGGSGSSFDRVMSDIASGPIPPPPLMTYGARGGGVNGGDYVRAGTTPMQVMTPTAAPPPPLDWDFASFPQTMDQFSSLFRSSFGPSPDRMGGSEGNMWMGY